MYLLFIILLESMSKVTIQLSKRRKIQINKSDIELQRDNQAKNIQENINKKMIEHNRKREKIHSQKINHFKLLDENWKQKMQQIHKKKDIQTKQSIKLAERYRKQAEMFWSHNNKKYQKTQASDLENQSKRNSVENNCDKKPKQYSIKFISLSKHEGSVNRNKVNNLPQIQMKSMLDNGRHMINFSNNRSLSRLQDQRSIREHIQKSKNLNEEKEELILNKAMEKLKNIQIKRRKCKENLYKSIKQAKIKRELREDPFSIAEKKLKYKQNQQIARISKNKQKIYQQHKGNTLDISRKKQYIGPSLDETIIQHKKAKQKREQEEFKMRDELLKSNAMKVKKTKLIKLAKQTINRLKVSALKDFL